MKIKNLLFGMLACTALVGCSSDDEPNVPVSGESYVAINIVSPGGSSRAEAGGYEVGSEQENAAEKALFVFFDKNDKVVEAHPEYIEENLFERITNYISSASSNEFKKPISASEVRNYFENTETEDKNNDTETLTEAGGPIDRGRLFTVASTGNYTTIVTMPFLNPKEIGASKVVTNETIAQCPVTLDKYIKAYGLKSDKEANAKKENKAQLEVWNQYLIEYGSQIIYKRLQYLKMLVPMARKVQQALTCETERFSVTYHCSMGAIGDFSVEQIKNVFQTILAQKQGEEIARGTTLWGPHRDDLIFYLNGMDLKKYGSQGQQRTGILSLKMAELQTFYKLHGEYPLLLLDDVMSELDDARRQFLMKMVKKYQIQTIITGANIELLTDEMAENEIFWVQEGKIITK